MSILQLYVSVFPLYCGRDKLPKMLESFICLTIYSFTNYTWINSSTIQQINSIGKSDIYPVFSIALPST